MMEARRDKNFCLYIIKGGIDALAGEHRRIVDLDIKRVWWQWTNCKNCSSDILLQPLDRHAEEHCIL